MAAAAPARAGNRWQRLAWLRERRIVSAVVLGAILLLALGVRVYRLPDLMVVGGDQARDALVVQHMLDTGEPILQGPIASTGTFHRGPAYYYLLAAAYWLSGGDPIGGALLSVGLDLAALVMAFVLARSVAGSGAGLVAAGLWAVAPIIVHFARFQWNPQNMVFFGLLAVYAALRIARGDGRWLLVLGPAWLIAWQLHEPSYFLVPMLAIVLAWKWRTWLKPRIVAGTAALSAIVVLPFVVEQAITRLVDVRAMLAYMLAAASGAQVPTTNEHGLPSAVDRVTTALNWLPRALPSPGLVNLALIAIALVGLAWLINRVVRQRSPEAAVVLLYAATPFVYAFWPAPLYSHYQLIIFPIPLILIGIGSAVLARATRIMARRVGRPRLSWASAAAGAIALAVVISVAAADSLTATAVEQPLPQTWRNANDVARQVLADAKGEQFALRIKADYFPHIDWYPEWIYPFQYSGMATDPTDPVRVDVPTYVIFDPADYIGGVSYGGTVVNGIRWAKFPPPTFGDQLLSDVWQFGGTGSGGAIDTTSTPPAIHLVADRPRAYSEAIQSLPVTAMTRYLVRYEYRTAAAAGAAAVYLQIFAADGTLLATLPDGSGQRHGPSDASVTASFMGETPAGAVSAKLIVRWAGVGEAWYSNVELRPVTADAAPW